MKIFSIICIVAVVLLTGIAAFSVVEGAQAAAIGGAGLVCLVAALALYVLVQIRDLVKGKQ
jgi:hypothetical protein